MNKRIKRYIRNLNIMICYQDYFGDIRGCSIFNFKTLHEHGGTYTYFNRFTLCWKFHWKLGMYHGQLYDGIEIGPFLITYNGL